MHDSWLQGVTSVEMNRAKMAHARQQARADAENSIAQDNQVDPNKLWLAILNLLNPGETLVQV